MTTGWLIGEIIRRISGKSLGQFFKEEISDLLNLEYWIGLPESEDQRVAKVTPSHLVHQINQVPLPMHLEMIYLLCRDYHLQIPVAMITTLRALIDPN